ncbi:Salicylate carboxymethyltransferase [Handroanthus impetiginosus]|uniref:Salicylate carboxymethyltransferase n=1 Tax=Handroanthus impetiginosus TaxID=429701 RepID=A0A2G9HGH3_9LAMI|nr:Salicylate carboxymethyltransferase [Handroanthus impetiginosus]
MDLEKVFHMKGGIGDTSYSNNSSLQKRAADKVKHITLETMEEMFLATRPKSLGIADLGCSSGPNTLSNIKELVGVVEKASRHIMQLPPEFRVYLNDLPTNDFNTIFQALPDLYRELKKGRNLGGAPIYIAAYPGTFYGRLFPDNCLHFIYSSNSLHWLSRVPPGIYDEEGSSINKKSIYISEKSPPEVSQAYFKQFQEDLSLFLKSRSQELISGGRMVLILLGRSGPDHVDRGNSFFWEILYQSLAILVAQGEVEEEKLDSYDVHFYAPSKKELEEEIRKEGSFKVELVETFEMDKDAGNYPSYGMAVAKTVRSIQESMLAHHFGEAILDKLFHHYATLVDRELAKCDIKSITTVLVLAKRELCK